MQNVTNETHISHYATWRVRGKKFPNTIFLLGKIVKTTEQGMLQG